MAEAANFMLQRKNLLCRLGVDDSVKTELVVAVVLHDKIVLTEEAVGPGKICHVNRDVVAIVGLEFRVSLTKTKPLVAADRDPGCGRLGGQLHRSAHNFLVETRDSRCSPWFGEKLDIRNSQSHLAKARRRLVATKAVAPGARDSYRAVFGRPAEARVLERLFHRFQSRLQGLDR